MATQKQQGCNYANKQLGPSDRYQSIYAGNEESDTRLYVDYWSEHVSSSGNKYYFNCETGMSQWKKPKELIERKRQQNFNHITYEINRPKVRARERNFNTGENKSRPLRIMRQDLNLIKQVSHLIQATDSHQQSKPSISPAQNLVNYHPAVTSTASSLPITTTYQDNSSCAAYALLHDREMEVVDSDKTSPVINSLDIDSSTVRVISLNASVLTSSLLPATLGTSSLLPAVAGKSLEVSATLKLSQSLANYYRQDLISHVVDWHADNDEHQTNRNWEETYNLGNLNYGQASAELKTAYALARTAEVQATLKEQRMLYFRQQTADLED